MNRWLARELADHDSKLVGFWPLQHNLLDYSGYCGHATSNKWLLRQVLVPTGDYTSGGWVNSNGGSYPLYSFINTGVDTYQGQNSYISLSGVSASTVEMRVNGLPSLVPQTMTARFIVDTLSTASFTEVDVLDRNGTLVAYWTGNKAIQSSTTGTIVEEFGLTIATNNSGIWDLSVLRLQWYIGSGGGTLSGVKIYAADVLVNIVAATSSITSTFAPMIRKAGRTGFNCHAWTDSPASPGTLSFLTTRSNKISTAAPTSTTQPFTLSCWVHRNMPEVIEGSYNIGGGLISTAAPVRDANIGTFCGYELCMSQNRGIVFRLAQDYLQGQYLQLGTTQTMLNGMSPWMHIVLVYDGQVSGVGTKLYVNGIPVVLSKTPGPVLTAGSIAGGQPIIGATRRGNIDYQVFPGIISMARIYNRALHPVEVTRLNQREQQINAFRPPARDGQDLTALTTLFMRAYDANNSNFPLYMNSTQGYSAGQTTLFINGINSGNANFYGTTTLFEKGLGLASQGMTLFIGDNPVPSMPLFLMGEYPSLLNKSASLFIRGANNNGLYSKFPLFMASAPPGASMNLFLASVNQGLVSTNMNLSVQGQYQSLSNWFSLFMQNQGLSSNFNLFIQGLGTNPGANIASGNMNLFLNRLTGASMPLFIMAPGTVFSNSIPLYLATGIIQQGSIPMFLDVVGNINRSSTIIVRGF